MSIIVAQPCQAPPEISLRVIPLCAATLTLHDGRRFMKGANFGFTSSSGGNLVGFCPPPATLKHKHWNVRCAPLMLYQPRYRSQFNAAGGERMTMAWRERRKLRLPLLESCFVPCAPPTHRRYRDIDSDRVITSGTEHVAA